MRSRRQDRCRGRLDRAEVVERAGAVGCVRSRQPAVVSIAVVARRASSVTSGLRRCIAMTALALAGKPERDQYQQGDDHRALQSGEIIRRALSVVKRPGYAEHGTDSRVAPRWRRTSGPPASSAAVPARRRVNVVSYPADCYPRGMGSAGSWRAWLVAIAVAGTLVASQASPEVREFAGSYPVGAAPAGVTRELALTAAPAEFCDRARQCPPCPPCPAWPPCPPAPCTP